MLTLKKLTTILIGFLLILLLAACNGTTETVDQNESTEETATEKETAPESLTLEEVFEKTTTASEDLHSFAVDMNLVQEIASDLEEANMELNSSIFMEVVSDPISFYQKMQMSIPNTKETLETESYFSKDGFYMHDPLGGTWMKFPSEMTDQLLQVSNQQTNPGEEIKRLQEFSDDFSFEEKDNEYHLTLTASGEEFNDFIQETIKQTLPADMAADTEELENIKIHAVAYDIIIDKETFFPKAINMNMDMEIMVEDQTVQLTQRMDGQYSKHNEIDEIVIPEEVMDTAEEVPL
ncbi:hypothetical protein SAMN05192533_10594 [Mesobacillus persicus]|uniref:Lipoprotein n=1 Tax=Mesobacillus persicus TaxID=930146 RepID=A0A1H8AR68_9BACI|nr:DUF6612 family protein [Mesobacillus persicus]SEM72318.1 hypothetical protein SAMN05192533_10594 [Mesobacillus persicus]